MTGNIIQNGTEAFTPIIDKLGSIATEFLPYMLYIALACASIYLAYEAVRFIIRYTKRKSKEAIRIKRERREKYYIQRERNRYRRILLEYGKHGYDIKDEREKHGFGRYHG